MENGASLGRQQLYQRRNAADGLAAQPLALEAGWAPDVVLKSLSTGTRMSMNWSRWCCHLPGYGASVMAPDHEAAAAAR